ncbi:hypothetical protein [Cronobacter dublinensis]|uniref:hypothetical protein n=1 Tax=Cronobacter dublinensis TaxID=413497 RepID=UPI00289448BA|nr:hypothetical protein [Cronobacter dublinensis]MDT3605981.1 hypothetical protein [Cronobacter dublinensis]
MKDFKGTPDPWTGKDVGICRQDRAGLQLGFIMTHDENRVAECAANARLIASAPDLLGVLQLILSHHEDGNCQLHKEDVALARAAIAKAIGEEE